MSTATTLAPCCIKHLAMLPPIQIRSHIGYLPSEAVFYRGMKVKDLLKLSADLHHKDCSAEREILCRRLQLDVNRKVDELSFGNRKKVAIAVSYTHLDVYKRQLPFPRMPVQKMPVRSEY